MERISKVWRSALAMVLAICMVISFVPVAAFAAEDEINYVSLGDSMTNGYCFTGYEQGTDSNNILTGEGMYGNDAYPNLFAAWLEETTDKTVNHSKLAVSAMRAEDLNFLLGGREMPTNGWFDQVENYSGKNAAELVEIYQDAIAEADVISMGIGNAAFGAYMVQYFTRMLGVMGGNLPEEERVDLEKALVVLEPEEQAVIRSAYESMMARTEGLLPEELGPVNIQDMIDMVAYIGVGFLLNYKGVLEQIIELNSDVEIVLVGLMNTTYGMEITGEDMDPIAIGDLMDDMINALNAYIAGLPAAMQAAGEWEDAKFYYAAQPQPEFIVQVFDDMAEAGWVDDGVGLSETIVRARTIKAYNEALRPMLTYALGMDLPAITVADVESYEYDEEPDANGLYEYRCAIQYAEQANAYGTAYGMYAYGMGPEPNLDDYPLVKGYFAAGNTIADLQDYAKIAAFLAPYVEKEISIAIYDALEMSLVASVDNMNLTLDGLLAIAGDIMGALGEMPEALSNSPAPKTIRDELHGWFTGSETALAMCKVFAMFKVGDGMSVHPTPKAHADLFEVMKAAYGEHTAKDETEKNVEYVLGALEDFLETYGPSVADQAYAIWVENGYQDLLNSYINELLATLDSRYNNYNYVVLPTLSNAVDALNAEKNTLNAELASLKAQLEAKKAELEMVQAGLEVPEIYVPDFSIDTELGNNEQTQVPENDCPGTGNTADELEAAIADLEHAIAVVEALIADVTADIEDMVALVAEITEAVVSLEKTLADVAAAAQDVKEAVDAVVTVLTNESAKGATKTFLNAYNAARNAALTAAEAMKLVVATVNDDFAAIETAAATLAECAIALYNKFDAEKEDILVQLVKDIPDTYKNAFGLALLVIMDTLEANEEAIDEALEAEKAEIEKKLEADKAALKAEYDALIEAAEAALKAEQAKVDAYVEAKYPELAAKAEAEIAALEAAAAVKLAALDAELQVYVAELAALGADAAAEAIAPIQAQIDRVNNDIATVKADLACAIEHINAALKPAHDALVKEAEALYAEAIAQLQKAYDELVAAYEAAVAELKAAAEAAIEEAKAAAAAAIAKAEAAAAAAKAKAEAAAKAAIAKVQAMIEAAIEEAKAAAAALEAAKNEAIAALEAAKAAAAAAVEEAKAAAKAAVEEAKAAAEAAVEEAKAALAAAAEDAKAAAEAALEEAKAAAAAAIAEAEAAAKAAIAKAQAEAEAIVKKAQDAADAAIKAAEQAAADLANKIQLNADLVAGNIAGIVEAAKNAANAAAKGLEDLAGKLQLDITVDLSGIGNAVKELGNTLVLMGLEELTGISMDITNLTEEVLHQATHSDLKLNGASTVVALGDGTAATESYVDIVAAELKAEFGIRGYTNYAAIGNTVASDIANLASYEALANASLITLGYGNVTMLSNAIANALEDVPAEYDWASLVGESLVPYVKDALNEVLAETAAMGLDVETTAMLNTILEGVAYGAVEYAVKLPQLIAAIRAINPDAVIVIVGQYNPLEGSVLSLGQASVDVSEYIGYFVDAVATHGIAYCVATGEAIFVEAPAVETEDNDAEVTIADLFKMMMKGFTALYPSAAGDAYIAGRILAALNITATQWGDANGNGKVNLQDAILILQAANGKDVNIDRVVSDVTGDGKITVADAIWVLKRANGHTDLFPVER